MPTSLSACVHRQEVRSAAGSWLTPYRPSFYLRIQDEDGQTARELAIEAGHEEVVSLLGASEGKADL